MIFCYSSKNNILYKEVHELLLFYFFVCSMDPGVNSHHLALSFISLAHGRLFNFYTSLYIHG